MHKTIGLAGAAAFALTLLGSATANAVVVTWSTCNGDGPMNDCDVSVPGPDNDFSIVESPRVETDPAGSNNNAFAFTENVEGLDRVLTASAHRTDTPAGGSTTTAILPAELTIFEGGLGVHWEIDGAPDESTGSPNHAVDNIGFDELVLFEFADDDYKPLSFMTGWGCSFGGDGDSGCEYGGTNSIVTMIGGDGILDALLQFLIDGTVLDGFTTELFSDVQIGELQEFSNDGQGKFLIISSVAAIHAETFLVTSDYVRYDGSDDAFDTTAERDAKCVELYGATTEYKSGSYSSFHNKFKCKYTESNDYDGGDAFKILQITGELVPPPPPELPEPATLALMGLGLVGLGLAARRRKSA